MVIYYDVRLDGVSIDSPCSSIQSARIKAYNHIKANPSQVLTLYSMNVTKSESSEPIAIESIYLMKNNRIVKGPYSAEGTTPTHIVHSDGTLKVY